MKPSLLSALLLCAALLPAASDEEKPPRDDTTGPPAHPEAATDALGNPLPPPAPPAKAQAAVSIDWIRLPRVAASSLLREKLRSQAEAPALHQAMETLIAEGKAARVDFSLLTVQDGRRAKLESIREEPTITDWDARVAQNGNLELTPGYTMYINLGITLEIEARIFPDLRYLDLNIFASREDSVGIQQIGPAHHDCRFPVLHDNRTMTQLILPISEWRLAGCWNLPVPPAGGFTDAVSPASTEVLLAFVRASVQSLQPAAEPQPLPQDCLLITEWIETTADRAADLSAQYPAAAQMREQLDGDIARDPAALRGLMLLPFRDRREAQCQGFSHLSIPAEFNLDAFRWGTPEQSVELLICNDGSRLEAEGDYFKGTGQWQFNLWMGPVSLQGTDPVFTHGKEALPAGARRAVNLNGDTSQLIAPGQTALVSICDNTPAAATAGDHPRRVLMHFLRVLP